MRTKLAAPTEYSGSTPHLSHREQDAYYAALHAGTRILDAHTITSTLDVRPDYARQILRNLHRKGAVDRVVKGQYAVVPPEVLYHRRHRGVDPRTLLHELMRRLGLASQYYVAYQSAAQMYDAAHQVPFVLQIALARQHRPIRLGAVEMKFICLAHDRFFGIEERQYQGTLLRVSDRERTALDLVDRPALGGGIEEVARTLRQLLEEADTERLAHYAIRLGEHSTAQRLGHLLEALDTTVSQRVMDTLSDFRGHIVVPLEPGGSSGGEVNRHWRVRVNVDLEDTEW